MEIEEQINSLDQRSEYAQEVLGKMPQWFVRWGNTVIFLFVLAMITLSWILKYPDIVPARVTLTTMLPPTPVVASHSGRLLILIDKDRLVERDQVVAMIDNSVNWGTYKLLRNWVDSVGDFTAHGVSLSKFELNKLGDLQAPYLRFAETLEQYQLFVNQDAVSQRLSIMEQERLNLTSLKAEQSRQFEILSEEKELASKALRRLDKSYRKELISRDIWERRKLDLLDVVRRENDQRALIQATVLEMTQLQRSTIELQLDHDAKRVEQEQLVDRAYRQLHNELRSWEKLYLLIAPISGKIDWSDYWADHQPVRTGDTVFTIVPNVMDSQGAPDQFESAHGSDIHGLVMMPTHNSGKVSIGQKVFIKLHGYAHREFGLLEGQVREIALISHNQHYQIKVSLPPNLKTSFGKQIPFKQNMQGDAEIVTEDLRLLERIFYQLSGVFRQ